MFYHILVKAHSGLRWLVLALLVVAIINALVKWLSKSEFKPLDRSINLFAMISVHIQVLLGIILLFISNKADLSNPMANDATRYFSIEHPVTMLLAAVLITIGHSRYKRMASATSKFRTIAIFYAIGLAMIFAMIMTIPQ